MTTTRCASILLSFALPMAFACSPGSAGFEDELQPNSPPPKDEPSDTPDDGDDGLADLDQSPNVDDDGELDADSACATSKEQAKLVPIDMFIAIDKSGSMDDNGKWSATVAAFSAFFEDPAAADLRVALRFWPDAGCDDSTCSTQVCSEPQVPLGSLSDASHAQALQSLLDAKQPDGGTPMSAALAGASKWAKELVATVGESEQVVIVLVTDGEPNGCDEDIADIASHAQDAWSSAGVPTFAVGLEGSNESQLDQIAMQGGTTSGFFIGNGNAQADLLAALKQIQESQISCTFAMPEGNGGTIDPSTVNVSYTAGDRSDGSTVGQVANESACGASGGWFYDEPDHPTKITLCPSTCDEVQSDPEAKIEVFLGCTTQPA